MKNEAKRIDFDSINIDYLPQYDIEDYDMYDEKDKDRYIKDVEKVCRRSFEYKQMVKFLKTKLNMRKCAFFENVMIDPSNESLGKKIAIHIHHDPLTLYEICKIILRKRLELKENIDEQITAKEVMLVHYNLLVGLIPLSETVHELVHNQYLFVPIDKVFGFYKDFVDMYYKYIDKDIKDKLDSIETATSLYNGDDQFILETHILHTHIEGIQTLPKLEDVQVFISSRLDELNGKIKRSGDNYNIQISPIK